MTIINNILKNILTNNLSIKNRYCNKITTGIYILDTYKKIFKLNKTKYSLYFKINDIESYESYYLIKKKYIFLVNNVHYIIRDVSSCFKI